MRDKTYVGDGVYAEFDGFGIVLTTEDGVSVSNMIYLEPDVLRAINRYAGRYGVMPGAGS